MDRLQSYGYVREIDEEARRVRVVASTSAVARDDMIIRAGGWQLRNYQRNPVVLWAHNDRELPIARAVETSVDGDNLVQLHEFATHPRAAEIFDLVRGGFLNATSVRWYPLEAGYEKQNGKDVYVFRKQELLEVSWVPVPADPGALVVRADGAAFEPPTIMPEPAAAAVKEPTPAQRLLRGFAKEARHG
ncbi:MAG: hypothetical protein FJ318_06070 [SAR202 cluster bacterium]|nr:hypothetical protein [SAR202 cluster bacterium]